ncbi:MAG: hypothetical protein NTV86_02395 [Planctomycetota bacterium]|nr:hypothetical protein [Planctomycetota bacterium]
MNTRILSASAPWFLLALLTAGCNWQEMSRDWQRATSPAAPKPQTQPTAVRVEMVNLTTRTRAANPEALTVEQFLAHAAEDSQAGRLGRLRRLVERYPDAALETLRCTDCAQAATLVRQAIAAAYDRLFVASNATGGWQRTLAELASRPAAGQAAADVRARAKGLIEQGRFAMAAREAAGIAADAPLFLRAEAARLMGIALLLDNQPARAAAAWRQARLLAATDACVVAELDLLTADALRRTGWASESVATWSQAARGGTRVKDPILWERIAELKPSGTAWPTEVQAWGPATQFDEGIVWRQIGQWRLERAETTAALLALTRAEAQSRSARTAGLARIAQAQTLLAMNQDAPAMAILNTLVSSPEPSVACGALAVLGVVNIRQGHAPEGRAMLQKAIDTPAGSRWPGFSRAQADLALALLTDGKEVEGLSLLHQAQDAFRREGRLSDLSQCLSNEAAYLRKAGNPGQAGVALKQQEHLDAVP